MFNFLKNIFSISEYSETRYIIKILGFKLKLQKLNIAKKRKQNPFYYYKKNNIDITTIPSAQGQIRDIQLSNLALLVEFDRICKKNNLQYWLDWGSLIGAIRHKGFIPWDDDVDLGMMASDIDKLYEIFDKEKQIKELYLENHFFSKENKSFILKIRYKGSKTLFLDIFPYYLYGENLNHQDRIKRTQEMKKQRCDFVKRLKIDNNEENIKKLNDFQKTLLKAQITPDSDLVRGVQKNLTQKNWFCSFNDVFPLAKANYEGLSVSIPNNYHNFLIENYGDYMAYPKKISIGHTMYMKLDNQEKEIIRKLTQNSTEISNFAL